MSTKPNPSRLWCDKCRTRATLVFRVGSQRLCRTCYYSESQATPEPALEPAPVRKSRLTGVEEFR